MTGLITMLVSTMGATGMASALKMLGGLIDRIGAAKEAAEKRELARELRIKGADIEFQKAVFGDGEGGAFARSTRRLLAIIGMLNLATISIICTLEPSKQLLTFTPPANQPKIRFLWGLVDVPLSSDVTVVITTGHAAIASVTILATIVGFYFTPGGRFK